MKNRLLRAVLLLIYSATLSSCWSYNTTISYTEDFKHGYSSSKPIYLSIPSTDTNSFYFILSHKLNSDEFFLKVRWVSKTKAKQFNGQHSLLKFLVDSVEVLSLSPIKPIKTVAFHIDPQGIEEEAIYRLTREELTKIAVAESVTVNLQGKFVNQIAYFNKIHTFKAFKNFLKNG